MARSQTSSENPSLPAFWVQTHWTSLQHLLQTQTSKSFLRTSSPCWVESDWVGAGGNQGRELFLWRTDWMFGTGSRTVTVPPCSSDQEWRPEFLSHSYFGRFLGPQTLVEGRSLVLSWWLTYLVTLVTLWLEEAFWGPILLGTSFHWWGCPPGTHPLGLMIWWGFSCWGCHEWF